MKKARHARLRTLLRTAGTITHPDAGGVRQEDRGRLRRVVAMRPAYAIPHYKKLDLARLLDEYDRILYVDTDVIIRDDAPICSSWYRSTASAFSTKAPYYHRASAMIAFLVESGFPPGQWDGHYYNTGMMVLLGRPIATCSSRPPVECDFFKEQTWFNTPHRARRMPRIFSLPHRFNRQLT